MRRAKTVVIEASFALVALAASTAVAAASNVILFESGSAEIAPSDRGMITTFATRLKQLNPRCVVISIGAYADAAERSEGIDVRRARAVYAALLADGVADRTLSITVFAAREPLVKTAPGVAEPQNRRVVLDWRWGPDVASTCTLGEALSAMTCVFALRDGTRCN